MQKSAIFRDYESTDKGDCLALFDANCPDFFAPNEREDYAQFLGDDCNGYQICEVAGRLVAAFGLFQEDGSGSRLCWIMLDPDAQGMGLGSTIMNRVIEEARALNVPSVQIAASHKSAPFFARFGAQATDRIEDGWGPGMHRVDMELAL